MAATGDGPQTNAVVEATITMADGTFLPSLWLRPPKALACLVLAHGAGAGMRHRGMASLAEGLAGRGIATLRFDFPFMAKGSRRPDSPAVAQAAVRAAVDAARQLGGDLPLFAGGRSFGGRMTSQAQASSPLSGIRGLVFFAYPLHSADKPSVARAEHLARVSVPMLFLQGTRDALASLDLLHATIGGLGGRATLELAADADHSFHVRRSSGQSDAQALDRLLDAVPPWMAAVGSP